MLDDSRVILRELAEAAEISISPVIKILHDDLGMRKLTAKWVPPLLTINQKRQQVPDSTSCLDLCNHNPSDFLSRLVTIDITSIHYYTIKSKKRKKQYLEPNGTALTHHLVLPTSELFHDSL